MYKEIEGISAKPEYFLVKNPGGGNCGDLFEGNEQEKERKRRLADQKKKEKVGKDNENGTGKYRF